MLTLEELAKREAAREAWGTQAVHINLEPVGHAVRGRPHAHQKEGHKSWHGHCWSLILNKHRKFWKCGCFKSNVKKGKHSWDACVWLILQLCFLKFSVAVLVIFSCVYICFMHVYACSHVCACTYLRIHMPMLCICGSPRLMLRIFTDGSSIISFLSQGLWQTLTSLI